MIKSYTQVSFCRPARENAVYACALPSTLDGYIHALYAMLGLVIAATLG